jgi:CHAT domain-containing protein
MQEHVGKLQNITKNAIEKDKFNEANNHIRLIVLSACKSEKIG